MYALATVFPVEQFILRTNVSLAKKPDSRIRLFELTMFSPDVLNTVRHYQSKDMLKENAYYIAQARKGQEDIASWPDDELQPDWSGWISRQEKIILEKAWYEKGIINWVTAVNDREL